MVKYAQITWLASELIRISAHRYRLFLEFEDKAAFGKFSELDLNRKSIANQFWTSLFDGNVRNVYGAEENPMTYILRHTQLLPRQLLTILESLIKASHSQTGGWRELKSDFVIPAVNENITKVAIEIFNAFRDVFPDAEGICRSMFGDMPTVFSYDELERRWRQSGKPADYRAKSVASDFALVVHMLLRIGVIGIVDGEPTDRYVRGTFSYDKLSPPNVGRGEKLCMHPIFSDYFRCNRSYQVAILPYDIKA